MHDTPVGPVSRGWLPTEEWAQELRNVSWQRSVEAYKKWLVENEKEGCTGAERRCVKEANEVSRRDR